MSAEDAFEELAAEIRVECRGPAEVGWRLPFLNDHNVELEAAHGSERYEHSVSDHLLIFGRVEPLERGPLGQELVAYCRERLVDLGWIERGKPKTVYFEPVGVKLKSSDSSKKR